MEYELYHHGVVGMHWGIRRYQNKDGSLTAEGIKRYRTDLKFKSKYDKYTAKQEAKRAEKEKAEEVKRIEKLKAKPIGKLTEAELNERINRIAMERRLSELESGKNSNGGNQNNGGNNNQQQNNSQKAVSAGKKLAIGILTATGGMILKGIEKKVADKALKKLFPNDDDKSNKGKKEVEKTLTDVVEDLTDTLSSDNKDSGSGNSSKGKKNKGKNANSDSNSSAQNESSGRRSAYNNDYDLLYNYGNSGVHNSIPFTEKSMSGPSRGKYDYLTDIGSKMGSSLNYNYSGINDVYVGNTIEDILRDYGNRKI